MLLPNDANDDYYAALAIIARSFKEADVEKVHSDQDYRDQAESLIKRLSEHDPALLICSFEDNSPLKHLGIV